MDLICRYPIPQLEIFVNQLKYHRIGQKVDGYHLPQSGMQSLDFEDVHGAIPIADTFEMDWSERFDVLCTRFYWT